MTNVVIRWTHVDLLDDVSKTIQYRNAVASLVNSLLKDSNVHPEILKGSDVHPEIQPLSENKEEYCFAVYVDPIGCLPLIDSVEPNDPWRPSFSDYIVEAYDEDHPEIVSLLEENSLAIKYILQELMYRFVDEKQINCEFIEG